MLAALAAAGALALVVWAFLSAWRLGGEVNMSVHGYVAMGLAAALTGLLGAGLMWLAFYSARKGYDERQNPDSSPAGGLTGRGGPPGGRDPHR